MIITINGHRWDTEQLRGILTVCGGPDTALDALRFDLLDAVEQLVKVADAYRAYYLSERSGENKPGWNAAERQFAALTGGVYGNADAPTLQQVRERR